VARGRTSLSASQTQFVHCLDRDHEEATIWTAYLRDTHHVRCRHASRVYPSKTQVIDVANRSSKTPKPHTAHPKSQTRPSATVPPQAPQTPMTPVEFARSSHLHPDITRAPAAQRSPPPKRTSFLAGWRARRMTRSARNPQPKNPVIIRDAPQQTLTTMRGQHLITSLIVATSERDKETEITASARMKKGDPKRRTIRERNQTTCSVPRAKKSLGVTHEASAF